MKKPLENLYAIYKDKVHKGNERGESTLDAIKSYIINSDLEEFLDDEEFLLKYSATIAMNGIHHHLIKY